MTAASAPHVLQRETFRTSRLLDFCSERELVKQIGHSTDQWPLVVLKELTDNALDAAEEAGTAPLIRIEVKDDTIVITDNGPGMPAETVAGILDVRKPCFVARSLRLADQRRAGQRAEDDPSDGLRARRCQGRDADREPRRGAPYQLHVDQIRQVA